MQKVAVGDFKSNALRLVARARRTGEPVVITRYGEEVARLVPERRSLREWLRRAIGFFAKRKKHTRKYASWGVFLKMR